MGATYTRQSSSAIVDGGVIEASDINAEFNQILAAFAVSSGHTHDGTAAEGGPITKLLGTAITIGDATAGTDIAVTFDGETADGVLTWMEDEDYFQFSDDLLLTTTEKLQFRDTAIYINSSADGQLDLVADTEIQIAATTIDINGAVDISGALTLAGTTLAETISDTVGAMVSSNTETGITVTYEDGDNTLDFALGAAQTTITSLLATDIKIGEDNETKIDFETANEIHLYAANAEQVYVADGIFGPQTDSDVDLGTTGVRWKDAFIDTITTTGNVTVGGDLTVSGDDITMGTNTAGNILVADGTNFNSIAVGGLSEISTVANDDVFLAVDTSGGGLKKIARSAVVAGLATSAAISNIVEDSTPQLGGDLDVNGNGLTSTSNGNIALTPNGTGVVRIDGSSGIDMQSGSISIKNSGAQSYIDFYCESSNAHYARLQAPAHSAFSGNITLTLPATTDTVTGIAATQTLTNKTLTSPKINEDVAVTSTATELNLLDGITAGTVSASLAVIADSNKDISGFRNVTLTGELDAGSLDVSGDADIDGTLEADAITVNGVTLAETISDTVGAMVGSNTETGISVTYDDSDNTLDFVIGAGSIVNSMLADDAVGADELASDAVVNASIASGAAIADSKLATISTANKVGLAALDIDGATDIGEAIVDADLFIVDNGAGGTNRKVAASRLVTYVDANSSAASVGKAIAMAIVFG